MRGSGPPRRRRRLLGARLRSRSAEGGVQLEWRRAGDELEIRVSPSGQISAFRFNEGAGKMAELERVSLADLKPLVALAGRL